MFPLVHLGGKGRERFVASFAYLAGRKHPVEPADLLGHRCIRQRLMSGAIYRWEFEVAGRPILIDPPGSLTLNNVNVMVQAALSGLGVAFAPLHRVADDLGAGRLVQLLAAFSPRFDGFCFYYPQRAITRARSPPLSSICELDLDRFLARIVGYLSRSAADRRMIKPVFGPRAGR